MRVLATLILLSACVEPTAETRQAETIIEFNGLRRCTDLAPECQILTTVFREPGLHCLPEYVKVKDVPCFCIGATTDDFWCTRQDQP